MSLQIFDYVPEGNRFVWWSDVASGLAADSNFIRTANSEVSYSARLIHCSQ
jgi:hypothetical protein